MTDIFVKVDTPYEDADGNPNFTLGMQEVEASEESAKDLVNSGKAEYVNEEDREAADQAAAEESDQAVQEQEVDNSARSSSSLGMKFGDANASNKSPGGNTDVSDAIGETGVAAEPQPSPRQRAHADTFPERQQAVEDARPNAASSDASTTEDDEDQE